MFLISIPYASPRLQFDGSFDYLTFILIIINIVIITIVIIIIIIIIAIILCNVYYVFELAVFFELFLL